jgi:hypothetical protein
MEARTCLMTVFAGRADSQSISQLNQLLDDGWRIAGIDPSLQRMPGLANFKAFIVELTRQPKEPE